MVEWSQQFLANPNPSILGPNLTYRILLESNSEFWHQECAVQQTALQLGWLIQSQFNQSLGGEKDTILESMKEINCY